MRGHAAVSSPREVPRVVGESPDREGGRRLCGTGIAVVIGSSGSGQRGRLVPEPGWLPVPGGAAMAGRARASPVRRRWGPGSVRAADTGNAAAGTICGIGQVTHHAQCFGATQVPRPVVFLEGRLVELARRAQVGGGADHAGSLGHSLQHRVHTRAACSRPGCHTVIWVWHGAALPDRRSIFGGAVRQALRRIGSPPYPPLACGSGWLVTVSPGSGSAARRCLRWRYMRRRHGLLPRGMRWSAAGSQGPPA